MSKYVRMIQHLRIPFWDKTRYTQSEYDWLPENDFPLELIVKDCRFKKKAELSIFKLNDPKNLDLILAAISVIRDVNQGVGYIIFDESIPRDCQIAISAETTGTTADALVNQLHCNLTNLTNIHTANLVNNMVLYGKVGSLSEEDLDKIVIAMHKQGNLTLRANMQPYWKKLLGS